VWRELAPELIQLGLLTKADEELFGVYVETIVTHRAAIGTLRRDGLVVAGSTGSAVKHPAASIASESARALRAIAGEFGMTPSSRRHVRVETSNTLTSVELDQFFTDGGGAD
jgi:P27 family predicted phage terminase small subunit